MTMKKLTRKFFTKRSDAIDEIKNYKKQNKKQDLYLESHRYTFGSSHYKPEEIRKILGKNDYYKISTVQGTDTERDISLDIRNKLGMGCTCCYNVKCTEKINFQKY